MNRVSDEMQGYVDVLQAVAEQFLPDEKPFVRAPMIDDDVIHVKLVVRGGRNVIDWSLPEDALGDDGLVADSLEKAIARQGLAGNVRVVRNDQAAVVAEAGSNVISPNPAVPPPAAPLQSPLEALGYTSLGTFELIPGDDVPEVGDDPDAFLPPVPPSKASRGEAREMQQADNKVAQPPKKQR